MNRDTITSLKDRSRMLLANTSWMLVSEVMAKASRIVTLLVFANCLTIADYGTAMLALACHEMIRVFMRLGIGSKIIQCTDEELHDFAGNAVTLQWLMSLLLAAVQIAGAELIAAFYDNSELTQLLQLMALSYLIYPWVAIKVFQLQRNNQLRYFGIASGLCIALENLGSALLLLLGADLLAVAFGKIIAAAAWLIFFARADVPFVRPAFNLRTQWQLLSFSSKVLVSELCRVLRFQADLLIAGRLLTPELFGIYSFAKSSGLGLGQSLSSAYLSGLYPFLSGEYRQQRLAQTLPTIFTVTIAVSAVFVLQALLAPVYIPLLFDAQWASATTLVSILCLTAIPALLLDTSALIYRIRQQLNLELLLAAFAVVPIAVGLLIIQPTTPMAFCICLCVASLLWLLPVLQQYLALRGRSTGLLTANA